MQSENNANLINQCTITLNRSCNLRCSFCYAKDTKYLENKKMDFDKLKKIVDFCKEAKIKYIVLTGGEPTLYPQIFDLIKYIKNLNLVPTIATNGLLLYDYDFCKSLVQSGIEYIDVSLKGFDKKNYYQTCGVDGFDKYLQAIKNLALLRANFTCSMIITKSNVEDFCLGVNEVFKNGAKAMSFTFEIDNELSKTKDFSYLKNNNPFDLIESFISKMDLLNSMTNNNWWLEYSLPLCTFTKTQLSLLKGKMASPCQVLKKTGITFDEDMNLIPCNMFFSTKMGQFLKDFSNYSEFLNFSLSNNYKKITDSLSSVTDKECESCEFLNDCGGGCPALWKNFSLKKLKEFKNTLARL